MKMIRLTLAVAAVLSGVLAGAVPGWAEAQEINGEMKTLTPAAVNPQPSNPQRLFAIQASLGSSGVSQATLVQDAALSSMFTPRIARPGPDNPPTRQGPDNRPARPGPENPARPGPENPPAMNYQGFSIQGGGAGQIGGTPDISLFLQSPTGGQGAIHVAGGHVSVQAPGAHRGLNMSLEEFFNNYVAPAGQESSLGRIASVSAANRQLTIVFNARQGQGQYTVNFVGGSASFR
jgi:hypothetical protein